MKIVFTGGATGGHFTPLVAIAEAIASLSRERRILEPQYYFMAPSPYDEQALFENRITFLKCPAGKLRRYFSVRNVTDLFVTVWGVLVALVTLFRLYPDVVISKGGYGSVPVTLAANILRIPVIIHESDAKPGRANLFAAPRAYRIAISYESSRAYFPKKVHNRIALTGVPIRTELAYIGTVPGAKEELGLDPTMPTILILGGSSGAKRINDIVVLGLTELVETTNIIHQTGRDLFEEVRATAQVALRGSPYIKRYNPFPYLNVSSMRKAVSAADLIVSRAGATAIAEIALWKKPALLIPIPEEISHDQKTNAYAYAHTGAAIVLEEANLTPHVLSAEIRRVLGDSALRQRMSEQGASFGTTEAATRIADEALSIGLSHEPETNA